MGNNCLRKDIHDQINQSNAASNNANIQRSQNNLDG